MTGDAGGTEGSKASLPRLRQAIVNTISQKGLPFRLWGEKPLLSVEELYGFWAWSRRLKSGRLRRERRLVAI